MNQKQRSIATLMIWLSAFAFSCEAPPDYRFHLSDAVDNPVSVSLSDTLASMQLARIDGLPIEPQEEILYLLGNQISLTVSDPETGTSFELTNAGLVDSTPTAPGQYRLSLLDDMSALMIVFFNQTTTGAILSIGSSYTAAVVVAPNDFFVTESFTRQVEVK